MTLEEKKKYRLLFLKKLYEECDGDTLALIDMHQLGSEIGIPGDSVYTTAQYLHAEGLLQIRTMDGNVSITHDGILEIEEAIENPDEQTEHFPPINIININSMENSVIQQGSPGGIQTVTFNTNDFGQIRKLIDELESQFKNIKLPDDGLIELKQEIETLKVQLASPKPKSIILNESLKTIKDLLLSVTANVYTPVIIEWITHIMKG
jgi:hypothetical protein